MHETLKTLARLALTTSVRVSFSEALQILRINSTNPREELRAKITPEGSVQIPDNSSAHIKIYAPGQRHSQELRILTLGQRRGHNHGVSFAIIENNTKKWGKTISEQELTSLSDQSKGIEFPEAPGIIFEPWEPNN